MLSTIVYKVVGRDAQTNAKVVELQNPVTGKSAVLTGAFFDLRSNEDFKFMRPILWPLLQDLLLQCHHLRA